MKIDGSTAWRSITQPISDLSLSNALVGLRHGDPAHRCLRGMPAWRSGHLSTLRHGNPIHKCFSGIPAWRRGLLAGLRHGDPAYRHFRGIPAWRSVLLTGLRHGTIAQKYLRGMLAWQSGRLSALRHGDPAHRCLGGMPQSRVCAHALRPRGGELAECLFFRFFVIPEDGDISRTCVITNDTKT